jgi:hypothetical protein
MKHLSLIFAIYLSVLALAPAFVNLFPCMQVVEQVCESVCENSCSQEPDCKDESGNNCPFGICCTNCLFFNAEQKQITFIPPSAQKEKILHANEQSCSDYIADCWHPPEAA